MPASADSLLKVPTEQVSFSETNSSENTPKDNRDQAAAMDQPQELFVASELSSDHQVSCSILNSYKYVTSGGDVTSCSRKKNCTDNSGRHTANTNPNGIDYDPSSSDYDVRATSIMAHALVTELHEMADAPNKDPADIMAMSVKLFHSIQGGLWLCRDNDYSFKRLEKIGKSAAKRLVREYNSANAVLKEATENTEMFEGDTERALNEELEIFQERPKTFFGRFFLRLGKAFCFTIYIIYSEYIYIYISPDLRCFSSSNKGYVYFIYDVLFV